MNIIESKNYKKTYNKILKNKTIEQECLEKIKNVIISSNTLHDVITSPFKNIYHIEQKKENLKYLYTARLNKNIRLIMIPVGNYPYNTMEITDIIFEDIDNNHYKK